MNVCRDRIRGRVLRLTGRYLVVAFGLLGLVPMEGIIPPLAAELFGYQLLIFKSVAVYFAVYTVCFSGGLRIVWFGDRQWLSSLELPIPFGDRILRFFAWWNIPLYPWMVHMCSTQFGLMLIETFTKVRRYSYDKNRPIHWRLGYYLILIILGATPYVIKFGLCLVTLRPNWQSYVCLLIGTTIRSYILVYIGSDILKLLF